MYKGKTISFTYIKHVKLRRYIRITFVSYNSFRTVSKTNQMERIRQNEAINVTTMESTADVSQPSVSLSASTGFIKGINEL